MSVQRFSHLCALVLVLGMASVATAQVPGMFHFSGQLETTNADFDGDVDIQIALYDDPTLGGAPHQLWSEMQTVSVKNGRFHVMLGADVTNPVVPAYFQKPAVYVGVTVGNDAEMTPRILLGSVPYASLAGDAAQLGGIDAGSYVTQTALDNANYSTGPHTVNTDTLAAIKSCSTNDTIQWNGSAWVCVSPAAGGGVSAFKSAYLLSHTFSPGADTKDKWHTMGSQTLSGVAANTLILVDLSTAVQFLEDDIADDWWTLPQGRIRVLINGALLTSQNVYTKVDDNSYVYYPFSLHTGKVMWTTGDVTVTVEVSKATDDHQIGFSSTYLRLVATPMQ